MSLSLLSTDLYQFLIQYKSDKGNIYTHVLMGTPDEFFNIPIEQKDKLIELLYYTTHVLKINVCLTEKPALSTIIKSNSELRTNSLSLQESYPKDAS